MQNIAADASALPQQKIVVGMLTNRRVQHVYHVAPLVEYPVFCLQRKRSKGGSRHQKKSGAASISETKRDQQGPYVAAGELAPVAEICAHCCHATGGQGVTRLR